MPMLTLVKQSLRDAAQGKPALAKMPKDPKLVKPLRIDAVAVLEGGTAAGKVSVMFHLIDLEGKHYYAELTENFLDVAAGFAKGWKERWESGEDQNSGPVEVEPTEPGIGPREEGLPGGAGL